MAKQQHELIKHGFTHILNATNEVENFFGQTFVYKKVPISDSEDENFKPFFAECVELFQRYIHLVNIIVLFMFILVFKIYIFVYVNYCIEGWRI